MDMKNPKIHHPLHLQLAHYKYENSYVQLILKQYKSDEFFQFLLMLTTDLSKMFL